MNYRYQEMDGNPRDADGEAIPSTKLGLDRCFGNVLPRREKKVQRVVVTDCDGFPRTIPDHTARHAVGKRGTGEGKVLSRKRQSAWLL